MGLRTWLGLKKKRGQDVSADYYQRKHETVHGYQNNNWLLSEEERLLSCRPETLIEVGFGNARFLRQVAPRVKLATGFDWAISPLAIDLPANVALHRADIVTADLPSADLVCSADVLEHFQPDDIDAVIGKMHRAGRFNYHVIACYESTIHLSVFKPEVWLAKFRSFSADYRLVEIGRRRGNKETCVIANYPTRQIITSA